jgi:hypothetical protein
LATEVPLLSEAGGTDKPEILGNFLLPYPAFSEN